MDMQVNDTRQSRRKTHRTQNRPPFECIALLLQGGGALGAYQAGVYQALSEAQLYPDWVAGISIGAINAALIAGNPPEARLEKLGEFWRTITTPPLGIGIGPVAKAAAAPLHKFFDETTETAASIGAMSLALITGKPLEMHAANLREYWQRVGTSVLSILPLESGLSARQSDVARGMVNQLSAGFALAH